MAVLTAVDGETIPSEAAEHGAELAAAHDFEHVVLHVMPQSVFEKFRATATGSSGGAVTTPASYSPADTPSQAIGDGENYTVEDGERHATGVARDVVETTLGTESGATPKGRVGEPVEEILGEARRRDVQYLVIGGRKRSPTGKALFGSKTQSILLQADRPVVTVMT